MKPAQDLSSVELRKRIKEIERLDLFDRGLQFFENLFLRGKKIDSAIQYALVEPNDIPKGYGLLALKQGIRVSKSKYSLKHLLRYVNHDIKDFTKIYRIASAYDVIVYGYNESDENKAFLVVGARMSDAMYYMQSTLNNTKENFQKIHEWFSLLQEDIEHKHQQDQNNAAI